MLKSVWFKSRTNLPCLSVAMNRTLTSFTRACNVTTLCGSSELDAAVAELAALRVGAPETYPAWARSWLAPKKVARKAAERRKIQFVYFMPTQSNFFTLNRFLPHSHTLTMHVTGRRLWAL